MKASKPSQRQSDNPKLGTVKGYADGGKVLPARQQEGGAITQAAQKAGLRRDNATLSQLAALVDQGYPIDKATRMVASQKQGKGFADGGLVDVGDNATKEAVKGRPATVGTDPNLRRKPIKAGRLFS